MMKKSILNTLCFLFFALTIHAQAPQAFKYQTVIRDAGGQILADQNVTIGIDLLQNEASVYSETHAATTNAYGLVNLEIGRGTVVSGVFNDIVWSMSTFVSLSLDISGGSDLQPMGTAELLSVPYALFSPAELPTDVNTGAMAYFNGTTWQKAPKLFIADDGKFSLGNTEAIAQKSLHLFSGNTPTIRLEQGGGQFGAANWDIGANEANFFIRENIEGQAEALPFRIRPGAPNNSINVSANGNVALGGAQNTHKLHVNGNIGLTGEVTQTSDRRVKTDILDSKYGLAEVMQLSPKTYYYDTQNFTALNFPDVKQLGLIAQEVGAVIPEVVNQHHTVVQKDEKSMKLMGVSYTKLIPVLITAIQEQQLQIQAKDQALEELFKEVELLKSQMTAMQAFLKPAQGNNQKTLQEAPDRVESADGRVKE